MDSKVSKQTQALKDGRVLRDKKGRIIADPTHKTGVVIR